MGTKSILLLSVFVASAVAGPLKYSDDQCARHCTESTKLDYKPGVYIYDYEADTITTMQGTMHEESRLHMKTTVGIEVLSKCEYAMKLRNTELHYSDPQYPNKKILTRNSQEFRTSMESNILKFGFQDGRIDNLCPVENEEPWILNIKRGILSTFQNTMNNLEVSEVVNEIDVAGKCTAEYMVIGKNWRNVLTIKKSKDLVLCTERSNVETALQGTPYTEQPVKSLPLVKGNQVCEQTFSSNILQSTACTESHIFRPFSKQSNGAVTKASQKLTFKNMHNTRFTGNDYRPTRQSLLFDHKNEQIVEERNQQESEQIMSTLCSISQEEITSDVPKLFTQLVYKLRKLDHPQLMAINRRVARICSDNSKGRKLFIDAVAMVGTSASVRLMKNLLEHREITGSEADFWMTSLTFLPNPTTDMIAVLTPLLDGKYEQALLGVSGLVHTFCRTNKNCGIIPEVRDAVRQLVSNLGETCYSQDVKKILLSLKAIGNIGQGSEVTPILQRCYQNPQLNTEIRLAAIQAYRRFSCDNSREELLNLYTNYDEDTELRIASYLAVMECATHQTITIIKNTLENEVINQVGSFVWTHLVNLKESSNPLKKEIKDIVSNLYLMNKYNTDIRKFSRAMEGSMFFDSLNMGAHFDSNIIYSPESYIPRSAMLNLTFDLFGSTVNLFEIGGRAEHLDKMIERLFGPKGYLSNNIFKNWREKRSTSDNKISQMSDTFDAENRYNQDSFGSLYLKTFGNEIWYSNLDDLTTQKNSFDLDSFLQELARDQDIEFSKTFMFLDATYTIPTGSGFPLRLAVNGTASVGLKVGGKFDVRSLKQVDVRGRFQPSGAIEISSLMTINAGKDHAGLKMIATLHSSTWLDGLIEIRNGEMAKVQLNMPRDKMEIIDVQSKIFLLNGEQQKEHKGLSEQTKVLTSCTGKYTNKILGVELCSDLQLPDYKERNDLPLFPMSGAAVAHIYLKKTDPSLTSYNFEAKWSKEVKNNGEFISNGLLIINTPRSSIDRELTLEFQVNQPEKSVSFKFRTPVKKLGLRAKYMNLDIQKRFDISLTVDDIEKFAIQSSLRLDTDSRGGLYSPAVEIIGPKGRILAVTGAVNIRHGQRYSGQLTIEDFTRKPISINGNIDVKENERYEGEFAISSPYLESNVQGFIQTASGISSKFTLDYEFEGRRRETMDLIAKFRDLSASTLTKYTGTLSIQSTAMPQYTTTATWEMQSVTGHMENTLQINLGDGRRSRMHKITIQEIINYRGDLYNHGATVMLKMVYPERNIDYMFDMKHELTSRSLANNLDVQYATNKHLKLNTELNYKENQAKADIKVQYPGRQSRLSIIASHKSQEYKLAVIAQWQRNRQLTAQANFRNLKDMNKYEADGEIKISRQKPISFSASLEATKNQYVISSNLDFGNEKYKLNGNWLSESTFNHRFSLSLDIPKEMYLIEANLDGTSNRLNGDIDIKLSNYRHMTGKLHFSNLETSKIGSLEIAWDVDRNPRSVFEMRCEISTSDTYRGLLYIRTPKNIIRSTIVSSHDGSIMSGVFRTNHHIEIEWTGTKTQKINADFKLNSYFTNNRHQLNGNLIFTTPFPNYENCAFSINHNDNNQEWKSELKLKLNERNEIGATTEGKYSNDHYGRSLNIKTRITTPYENYERINVDFDYNYAKNEFNGLANLEWSYNKNFAFGVFSKLVPNSSYRTGFNISSHYRSMRQILGNVLLSKTNDGHRAQTVAQWDINQKVMMTFDGKQTLYGGKRTCLVTGQIITPFNGYENIYSKIIYINDGKTISIETEETWGYNKLNGGISISLKKISNGQDFEAKLYFNTPFKNYENFQTILSHFYDNQKFKSSAEITLPRNPRTITLRGQGKWVSINDAEINILLTSPFKIMERFSIDIVHRMPNSNSLRTVGEIIYGNNKMTGELTASHSNSYQAYNTEIYFQALTPFLGYEEIKTSFVNNRKDFNFFTVIQASINANNNKLENSLRIDDILNVEEHLQITSSHFKTIQMSIKQSYRTDDFKHKTELRWGRNQRLNVEGEYKNRNLNSDKNIEISFKAETPFNILKSANVYGSYKSTGTTYSPELTIEWNGSSKMAIEGSLINNKFKKMEILGSFRSSFNKYEYISVSGNYDLTSPTKTTELKVVWDTRNRRHVMAKGSITPNRDGAQMEIYIATPFKNYEAISLNSNYVINTLKKSASLQYKWNSKQININTKYLTTSNGVQIELSFSSPFQTLRRLILTEGHSLENNMISGETSLQWNDKKTILNLELFRDGPKASFKASFRSPFKGYETVLLQIKGDLYSVHKTFDALFLRDVNKKYEIAASYETSSAQCIVNIIIHTPWKNYEELSFGGQFQNNPSEFRGNIDYQSPRHRMSLDSIINYNAYYPTKITLNINTPFSPFKNVRFLTTLNKEDKQLEFRSNLEWDNVNKMDLLLSAKNIDNRYEAKAEINTPFRNFRSGNIVGTIQNEDGKVLRGKISIKTPFQTLSDLELSGLYQNSLNGFDVLLMMNTPEKKLTISSSYSNNNMRPVEVKLNIDAPFTSFRTFNFEGRLTAKGFNYVDGKITINNNNVKHALILSIKNEKSQSSAELKINSNLIYWQELVISYDANYLDKRNMEGTVKIEMPNEIHKLTGNLRIGKKDTEATLKLQSPYILGFNEEMVVNLGYGVRRNRIEFKASATSPKDTYSIEALYNNDNFKEITGQVNVKYGLESINSNLRYINSNNKIIEANIIVNTPYSKHSIEGTIKNYETEKDMQIKLISPFLSYESLSITGSMRNDNYQQLDGSIVMSTPTKELRISGNMNRNDWNNFEAFITVNTPFEQLRMLRIDSKFLNKKFQNIEGNLEIQSSNKNLRMFGVSGKFHRSHGAEELSINVRLPSREYPTIGLLTTLHYTPGENAFIPRLTVSLPNKRYSIYGNYESRYQETQVGFGCEWGKQSKIEIDGNLKYTNEGFNGKLTVITPFKDYENQEISINGNVDRRRHTIFLIYKNAGNDVINIRGHLTYNNNVNFNMNVNVATPYRGFEDVSAHLKQEYRNNKLVTAMDYTWERYRKIAFAIENIYNKTHVVGQVFITSPYEVLRSSKAVYFIEKNYYNTVGNGEFEFNNKPVFKIEGSSLYDRITQKQNRNLMVNLPTIPFSASIIFKPVESGAETTIKTNYPSRSVSLHTLYQWTEYRFGHSAELTWDEHLRHSLSYEMRVNEVSLKGKSGKEIYGRLNLPIRSLEVRAHKLHLKNECDMEVDFYWDVARDPQKYLILKLQHEDQSNWQNTGHKVTIGISHPRLPKEIVATGQMKSNSREVSGKLEFEYSRYQQHNILLEATVRNMASQSKDIHYMVYVVGRQPISNTDFRLTGEIVNTDEKASTNFKIDYLDRHRQQRVEELKAQILKLREQINLITKSDSQQVNLIGRMFHQNNEVVLSLEEMMNEQPSVHSYLRFSKKHSNMDLNITTTDRENLRIRAAMPNDAVHFEVTHGSYDNEVSDVLFHLGLKNSRILKSRLIWRPQIWTEIKHVVSDKYNEVIKTAATFKDKISSEISDEFNSKIYAIDQAMNQELGSFKNEMSHELERLRYDYRQVNRDLQNMYEKDEFYLQSGVEAVGTAYDVIGTYSYAAMDNTGKKLKNIAYYVTDCYDYAVRNVGDFCDRNSRKLIQMYRQFSRKIYERINIISDNIREILYDWATVFCIRISQLTVFILEGLHNFISIYAPYLEKLYSVYQENIVQFYTDMTDAILQNPYYQAISEYCRRVIATINEFYQLSFTETVGRTVSSAYNIIADNVFDYFEASKEFHEKYLKDYYIRIYEHGSYFYRTLGIDDLLNSIAAVTYQKAKDFASDICKQLFNDFINMQNGFKYEYQPKIGKITFELPLPSQRHTLKEALDVTSYPEFQKMIEFKDIYLSGEDYCIWDTYYKYKHYLEESLKMPPFDTYAMMAGNQHYITFDKFHFDFVGQCSYLLARDFVDGNFTVIVNYARDGRDVVKKSLSVLSDDQKIDIGSDYKVTVEDSKVELPWSKEDTSVTREGSIVTVENNRGIKVRCNFIHDICTVHMSGFYFAKTGGLFGTYDYEPRLDMMTPDRRLVDDIDSFANSWEIGNAVCKKRPNMALTASNDYRAKKACQKLFDNKESIFRPCYKQVNPLEFYNMCMQDLSIYDSSMFDEKICTSAAAYMTECNMAGVPVRMPKSCVRCEKHDGNIMNEGDVIKITKAEPVQTADVVFIVERKKCNKDAIRMIEKLAQGIEDNLRQKEYRNIRYAVVGFGGKDIFSRPHLQTNDGREFGNIRSINSAFSSLIDGDWSNNQPNSVFEAIRYAAGLPFRMGSTKTFILFKCSDCKAEEVKADYSEMLRTLLDGDITLHLLMKYDFKVKSNKAKPVFGLDKSTAYTIKDVNDPSLNGDPALWAQLKKPKDFCVPLAFEANGSFFNSGTLTETKRNKYKKFIDVLSRRIAKTSVPSDCQVCECIATVDGIGKSTCQRCVSPIVANMITPDISPIIYPFVGKSEDDSSEEER